MRRVEETISGVALISQAPRPAPNVATGGRAQLKRPARTSPWRPVRVAVLGALMLLAFVGMSPEGRAQTPPPAISGIKPAVAQPGDSIEITFNQSVKPLSARIANTDAPFVPAAATGKIEVTVAENAPLGKQGIAVTLDGGATLNQQVIIVPRVSGLKAMTSEAEAEVQRGAIAGGETVIQFDDTIPADVRDKLKVMIGEKEARVVDRQANYLLVEVPTFEGLRRTAIPVEVSYGETVLKKQLALDVTRISFMYLWSSIFLVLLIALVYVFYKWRMFSKNAPRDKPYSFLTMAVLEEENMTYSLSRAQFLVWLMAIIWCYLFLYLAHGYVENDWGIPNLGGAIYTFLISLGTLVVAQATTQGQGAKGAGEVHPSPADFVMHGGVLALDRVQQVVWTVLAIGMFIRTTVSTYDTATALPAIPQELLVLMGLSSAGYLGGKLVRGAGPIIEQVTVSTNPETNNIKLNLKGKHFSNDCFVWLDGMKQPKDTIHVLTADPDSPSEFAKELQVDVAMTIDDWRAKDHGITVVNDDAQRADWRTGPEIVEVTGAPTGGGQATLTIKGARLAKGAILTIAGAPDAKPLQDLNNPNLFTVAVAESWLNAPHQLTVTSNGHKGLYTYTPKPADGQPGGDQGGNQGGGERTGGGQGGGGEQAGGDRAGGDRAGGGQAGSGQATDNVTSLAGEQPPGGGEIVGGAGDATGGGGTTGGGSDKQAGGAQPGGGQPGGTATDNATSKAGETTTQSGSSETASGDETTTGAQTGDGDETGDEDETGDGDETNRNDHG